MAILKFNPRLGSPYHDGTYATFTGSDKTVTFTNGRDAIKAGIFFTTGKIYAETTLGYQAGGGSHQYRVGFCLAYARTYGLVGSDSMSFGSIGDNTVAGTYGVAIGTFATGSIIRMAADVDNDLYWLAVNGGNWNGSGTADPATGTGGVSFSAISPSAKCLCFCFSGYETYNSVTVNGGSSAFTYSVPSGFTAADSAGGYALFDTTVTPVTKFLAENAATTNINIINPFEPAAWSYYTALANRSFAFGAGKGYCELYLNQSPNDFNWRFGIANGATRLDGAETSSYTIGSYADGWGWHGGPPTEGGVAPLQGQIFRCAVDFDNDNMWVAKGARDWSESPTANPATNTGGSSIATVRANATGPIKVVTFFFSGNGSRHFIWNFGAMPFVFPVPAGFSSVDSLTAATGYTNIKATQVMAEVGVAMPSNLRITQQIGEAACNYPGNIRLTQAFMEVAFKDSVIAQQSAAHAYNVT